MKTLSILGVILLVALLGCDEDKETCTEPCNTPATVFITYPGNNATVFEIAKVTCMVAENDSIKNVTLWVDGYPIPGAEDSSEPYELYWNTAVYEDLSSHTIVVRALYIYRHISDSEPITLKVDNTDFYPAQVNIQSIVYQDDSFIITWRPSMDRDFHDYCLYQSFFRDMRGKTPIYSSTDVSDTTHVVDNITANEIRHYQLSVVDTVGLETLSHVFKGSSSDLVAYYPFNGNADDESGNENHGVVHGATLTEDRFGNPDRAWLFDGDNDWISIADSPDFHFTDKFSVSVWVKLETSAPYYYPYKIIEKYSCWHFMQRDWDVIMGFTDQSDTHIDVPWDTPGVSDLSPGIWYHFVMTFDGTLENNNLKAYTNGVLVYSADCPGKTVHQSNSNVVISYYEPNPDADGIGYYFDGVIDDILIYKRALSQTEIDNLYNQ